MTSKTGTMTTPDKTARIGRFVANISSSDFCDEPIVSFATSDGRVFGDIRLSTAKDPVVVDLYESAMWRLGLLSFDTSDYCLNDGELAELRAWANSVSA